jgi:hypothetical protein
VAEPETGSGGSPDGDRLSLRDKIVAAVLILVLAAIILAIFRLGFAALYG